MEIIELFELYMKKNVELAIFTDFDGTITTKDIGDEIFKEFGEFEPHHSNLKSGILKIDEYWKKVCSAFMPGTTAETIREYALSCETDPWFKKFADYCSGSGIPLTVVSDGFDLYIEPVMSKLGLSHLPLYCNNLHFSSNGLAIPYFPGASESCHCLCASCKRNAILAHTKENSIIIFIGDGYSDYCAAEHADIIFAKKDLAAFCTQNKLPHYPFSNFFDVYRILTDIIPNKKLKIRNQAKLLRNKAFETE
jgi:2-hydroxy-3-keto-5-methylthiopentenyl-1-phosphate phosphatase